MDLALIIVPIVITYSRAVTGCLTQVSKTQGKAAMFVPVLSAFKRGIRSALIADS